MSVTPKVVFQCNHMIVSKDKKYGIIKMKRSDFGLVDQVPSNISIIRIDNIYNSDKTKQYSKGINYNQTISKDIIEWSNNSDSPNNGEEYCVLGSFIKTFANQYNADSCPRCYGNGWYVDLFGGEDKTKSVEGSEKLIQDFIKIFFTDKRDDSYGTKIRDVVGQNVYDENELYAFLNSVVDDCSNQLQEQQMKEILNGNSLPSSEKLKSIEVKDIIYSREEQTCYINLAIMNCNEDIIGFTFTI